tara:strand:+ start:1043 stop:1693 length:651 start_codon:yes stop_codon:yes gene_type:complete
MAATKKNTELKKAINTMLTSIGEQPIQNVDTLTADAGIAKDILDNVNTAVQSRGWIFNTDLDVIKKPDRTSLEIVLGPKVLRVDTTTRLRDGKNDIVERGGKLYDRQTNSHIFAAGSEVKVDIITELSFEDLPEPAKRYITIRSARIFHDRVVGANELHKFYQEDEMQAWIVLMEYEGDVADYNIFDNYDVYRVVDRLPGTSSNRLGYNVIQSYTT